MNSSETSDFIDDLSRRGVHLWIEGETLRYRAPRNALSAELRQQLKARKADLLEWLRRRNELAPRSAMGAIAPDHSSRHDPFPLTDIQQAYWVGGTGALDLSLSPHFYKEREFYDLDLERFTRAWGRIMGHHEMLRARLTTKGEQQILPVVRFVLPRIDLTGIADAAADREQYLLRQRMKREGPILDTWPLFQLCATLRREGLVHLHFTLSLLICDAMSSDFLFRQLLMLYQDPDMALEPIDLSFRDYVMATVDHEERGDWTKSMAYWQARAETLPGAPEMPLVKAPSSLGQPNFSRFWGSLNPTLAARLRQKTREEGLTLTALIAAAYAEVVGRWSKQQHFLLNILFFNRPLVHPQINRVLGNFSTTILLEVDLLNSGQTFLERAKVLQERLWADIEHAQVSGVQVLREVHRKRAEAARSAVPIVLASTLGLTQTSGTVLGSEEQERPDYDSLQTPQVWLDHQVGDRDGALFFNWDGVGDLFPRDLLDAMFSSYCTLLERLASEESFWQANDLDLLPKVQKARRAAANATDAEIRDERLHRLVAGQVFRSPERVAVVDSERTLTYRQLWLQALFYSERLIERGVRPNQLVGVVMEKGWEQVVAVLAIQEAGAAYLPVDVALPEERRFYLLEHSDVEVVLAQPSHDRAEDHPKGIDILAVRYQESADATDLPPIGPPRQSPDDLAYVIFTSGSTGQPKGVMIRHRAAVNTILDINRRFEVGPEDRVFALSSLSFDLSVYDIFGLLAVGGQVVIPAPAKTPDPALWHDQVCRNGITLWNSVPALMTMFADFASGRQVSLPPSLRLILMSGDWIPIQLPGRIQQLADGPIDVISLGGATEASIWSIFFLIHDVEPSWVSIPYGKPLTNQTMLVLNDRLEPCPDWVTGHIHIGGTGLADGYLKDPEKTARSFFIHPATGQRIYRTGDLGRYLPSGDIEILGREDFQVKVQGYRIELGEIESALALHPAVHLSVVTAVGEKRGSKRLVAYVVRDPDDHATETRDLEEYLLERLPEYTVPSRLVWVPDLPLTGNGKVDRAKLSEVDGLGESRTVELITPRNPLEEALAAIWTDLLGVEEISVRDDFFDVGGHSLLAVRLMSRIEQDLGAELPLGTLFASPTIEALANLLQEADAASTPASPVVPIHQQEGQPIFFCVHPVGGSILCYTELARSLSRTVQVYGVQSLGDQGAQRASQAVELEELASEYLDAIREHQPAGPYYLGGWSMGGVVAFEMARQLRAKNEEVGAVILIDSQISKQTDVDEALLTQWFARDLGNMHGRELEVDRDRFVGSQAEDRLGFLEQRLREARLPVELDRGSLERQLAVFIRNYSALLAYDAPSYVGEILLILAAESPVEPIHSFWQERVQGIEVEVVQGTHYTMVQSPGVQDIARQIGRYLLARFEKAKFQTVAAKE